MATNSKRKFDEISQCETSAAPTTYRISQKWTIKNFDALREQHKVGELLLGDEFGDKSGSGYTWQLGLFPGGKNNRAKDFISACLYSVSAPEGVAKVCNVKFDISLFDSSGAYLSRFVNSPRGDDFDVGYAIGDACFWLFSTEKVNKKRSTVEIVCEVEFPAKKRAVLTTTTATAVNLSEKPGAGKLFAAIGDLRTSGLRSDFTIVAGGDSKPPTLRGKFAARRQPERTAKGGVTEVRRFAVHSVVLASQSRVFAAMFEHEWKEVEEGSLDLVDASLEAVDAMLDFLYTGGCTVAHEFAREILNLAEMYHVDGLKAICETQLAATVVVANVGERFAISKLFALEQLKWACCGIFVAKQKEILQSPEWAAFKKQEPAVAIELLECTAV